MIEINPRRVLGRRNAMIYGHFIEHFHRQIYGGLYDPASPLSNEKGLRSDVVEALRRIQAPIIRWPGGCFVSAYHWRQGVGNRQPAFDKAWRVEDPNTFGTDEFMALCREIGCAPYICTNAGTGTAEEMSDWVEYCNLEREGINARARIANGSPAPYGVKYWSIGNENYGFWEIGAKDREEWSRLVTESAKMMKRVDPAIELSAAALPDAAWNLRLLESAGDYLDWISIHEYWDPTSSDGTLADYEQCMAYTANLSRSIDQVVGMLEATGYAGKIKISFDEWNLRGWYHPNAHTKTQPTDKEQYLTPRNENDDNSAYTLADTVFTACFLHTLNRACNHVQMANYAPSVNTRGLLYTHPEGLVKRGTYHVFDLFVNHLGSEILDLWNPEPEWMEARGKDGAVRRVEVLDLLATRREDGKVAISLINKHPEEAREVTLRLQGLTDGRDGVLYTLTGASVTDYNDVHQPDRIAIAPAPFAGLDGEGVARIVLGPHSVNVLEI